MRKGRISGEEVASGGMGSIWRESSTLAFEVEEDPFEVGNIEDALVFGDTEKEGVATEVVDLASDALGVMVNGSDEVIGEELGLTASDVEVVLDVGSTFLEVEGIEVETDGDALVESFVGGKAELVSETGLTKEDESEERSGVELVVEEETELLEEVRREKMSLIDDEQGGAAFAGEVAEGGMKLGEGTGKVESRFDVESEKDLVIKGDDGELGVREVDDGVEIGVEGLSESTNGGGFTGADVAGDESGDALMKSKGEAALDLGVPPSREEVLGGDGFGKGGVLKAVELIQTGHRFEPPWIGLIWVGTIG
jgi:hypothetical protein